MMKKTIFSIIASVLLPFIGVSQAYDLSEPDRLDCGTAILHNQLLIDDPSVQLSIDENERFLKEYAKSHASNKGVINYTIPVVYHVIHNNGPENVPKADIEASMANLNEDFQKLNSDIADVIPAFAGITADIEVQFKLATIDPDGNCTEGITRTVSQLTYAMDESAKSLVRWDPDMYLNIWVGQTMASGSGGYSYSLSNENGQIQWFWSNNGGCTFPAINRYLSTIRLIRNNMWQHIAVVHTPTNISIFYLIK